MVPRCKNSHFIFQKSNNIAVDLIKAKTIILPSLIMPVARQCRETPIPLLIFRRGVFVRPHFCADKEM